MQQLLKMGATEYDPITKRGEGFTTAAVIGPFGNILGVMYNRHYLDILAGVRQNNICNTTFIWKPTTVCLHFMPKQGGNGENGWKKMRKKEYAW